MLNEKYRQRLDALFSDIERLATDPLADTQAVRCELEELQVRIRELEAQFLEIERRAAAPENAPPLEIVEAEANKEGTRHIAPLLYEKEHVGYAYTEAGVKPLQVLSPAIPETTDTILAPLLASGQTIGIMQIEPAPERPWTKEEENLLNAVAGQASLQIQNLRLLAEAERSRAEAESATRRFMHENWDSYLDAIHHSERVGYAYDQASVSPYSEKLSMNGGVHESVMVMDEQVGTLYLNPNPAHPFTNDDKALVSGIARQIAQQVENLRLLADATRARAEAEEATRRLTRENWQSFTTQKADTLGFAYDLNQVSPSGETHAPQDISFEQALVVRGEAIGQLTVAGLKDVPPAALELANSIAEQVSAHIENLRLLEQTEQQRAEAEGLAQELEVQKSDLDRQYKASSLVNSLLDMSLENVTMEEQLQRALDVIISTTFLKQMPKGAIFLVEGDTKTLVLKANRGLAPKLLTICALVPFGRCLCGRAAATGQIQFADCVDHRHENTYEGISAHGHYNVPILSEGNLLGVLVVYLEHGHQKSQWEMDLLQTLSNTLASMIERKLAEDALAESTRQNELILDSAGEGIFGLDTDGNHTFVNPAAAQLLGFTEEELIGKHSHNTWHHTKPDGTPYPADECPIYRSIHSNKTEQGDEVFIRKDGTKISVIFTATPMTEGDRVVGAVVSFRDITQSKRDQAIIAQRAVQLETVATVSSTASTVLDPDKLLQAVVNLTKERFNVYHAHIYLADDSSNTLLLAAGAGEIGRQMVADGWSIPINHEQSVAASAARNRQPVIANEFVRDEDPPFLSNQLLPDTRSEIAVPMIVGGKLLGVFDVQADTANYFTEEDASIYTTLAAQVAVALQNARLYVEQAATLTQLRELDRLKSSFLANMSHELRTPLNSILGFADVMLEELDGPLTENMNNDLGLIQKNGQHLLHLINDVLDMAKIESGKMNLSPERFRVHELLEEVTSITSTLASEKNLSLFIEDTSDHGIEIFADNTRLRQVMINLVNNSIKFTEKGKITLHAAPREGGKVLIRVKDTGIGIPPDQLEDVFQEFTQVDSSTTRKTGGTGLGLPISRRLVEMHGGRIWAESAGINGEGASFFVELPVEARITEVVEKMER